VTEPGRNGLLVVPDSHVAGVEHSTVERNGTAKPQIGVLPEGLQPVLVEATPGTIIAFNDRLIHGGALNLGSKTRVSAEITLVFDRARVLRDVPGAAIAPAAHA
jgi:ectoine hydroxylase-related dioxygenase (phytanoyl-CoA dioxygenase family)